MSCNTCDQLQTDLERYMCKYQKAMRALESLTPSGSEFVGDVERCLSHVRDRIETQHRLILKFSHQAKELKAKLATTTTAEVADIVGCVVRLVAEIEPRSFSRSKPC